ncbi:hypothetical protein [Bacillus salipaludis]|uniref:Right handed beta helix domain-containing protein n=1 Tax=Bacillus salipaludis TaxID=2547811 RepID=A0AA90R078_9BACI|nr:hypothetical protein [Bacillus salipaludis]MDQ6600379.1 hypothetical protein [Bacillus salipaludis]
MQRRNFIINFILWILSFVFGYKIGNTEDPHSNTINDNNGVLNFGDIKKLNEQLSEKATKVDISKTIIFYVSTSGNDKNDGLTFLTSFRTLQKAFDTIKKMYNVIDGTIKIDIAAGTYEQSATIDDVKSKNRIQIIGKKDVFGVPTVIFEGANNSSLPFAMSFSGYMNVLIQDVKAQNFAKSSSRSGIVGKLYTNIWTKNVHAYNCGFAGINMDVFCRLYVEGGTIDACRIGIRAYSNCVVTIGYNNPSQNYKDPNHPIIKNCKEEGVLLYNMSTGHLDFCELDANEIGVTIENSSRLHIWKCLIKNSTKYGVLVGSSSTWVNDENYFQSNAKDYKRGAYSTELSQTECYTPIMQIEPTVALDKTTLTGTTKETYFNSLNDSIVHRLNANTFVTKGQKLKIMVTGSFKGAGTKRVQLKIGTRLITGFTSESGSTKNFCLEVDYYAINGVSQKAFGRWSEGDLANIGLYSESSARLTETNDLTVTGTLSDTNASIVIESFEVREIA